MRNPHEQRVDLCTKAYEAGIALPDYNEWWPALSPLSGDERKLVRAAVKKVITTTRVVL